MNIFNNFSYKLFGVVTALFCYTSFVHAEDAAITTSTICQTGYYLSSCNQIKIGTNWLKGIKGTTTTPDYYSYGSSASDNMTNLRKFFAGIEAITFYNENAEQKTVTPSGNDGYKNNRDTILTKFCTNGSQLASIECKKCPNNAKIEKSTVNKRNYTSFLPWYSWSVHTIADCYMDEFSDNTGTYVYAKNIDSNGTKQKCYYSNVVEGDELVSE